MCSGWLDGRGGGEPQGHLERTAVEAVDARGVVPVRRLHVIHNGTWRAREKVREGRRRVEMWGEYAPSCD